MVRVTGSAVLPVCVVVGAVEAVDAVDVVVGTLSIPRFLSPAIYAAASHFKGSYHLGHTCE